MRCTRMSLAGAHVSNATCSMESSRAAGLSSMLSSSFVASVRRRKKGSAGSVDRWYAGLGVVEI